MLDQDEKLDIRKSSKRLHKIGFCFRWLLELVLLNLSRNRGFLDELVVLPLNVPTKLFPSVNMLLQIPYPTTGNNEFNVKHLGNISVPKNN